MQADIKMDLQFWKFILDFKKSQLNCSAQDRLIIFQNIVKLSDIGHMSILVHDFVPIIFVKQSVFKKKMRIFLINKKFSMLNDQ